MSGRVLVVGDIMTDIMVIPDGPIFPGSDRRAQIRNKPGGSGANQAVWLGSSGVDVVFAGRVAATDRAWHEDYFRAHGVTPVLAGDAELPTGVVVALLDPSGERSFLTERGANVHLCRADLPDSLLDGVGLVMISGYSFFWAGPRSAVRDLLKEARARRIPIAIDPGSTGFLAEVGVEPFLGWVGPADWLFANEDEAEMLAGEVGFEEQMRILGRQFTHVVVKRGRFGAALGGAAGVETTRVAPIVKAVDSTGAGDAFAAGFLSGLMRDMALDACLEAGVAKGAEAVQTLGGQPK